MVKIICQILFQHSLRALSGIVVLEDSSCCFPSSVKGAAIEGLIVVGGEKRGEEKKEAKNNFAALREELSVPIFFCKKFGGKWQVFEHFFTQLHIRNVVEISVDFFVCSFTRSPRQRNIFIYRQMGDTMKDL